MMPKPDKISVALTHLRMARTFLEEANAPTKVIHRVTKAIDKLKPTKGKCTS